jgi:hypothetical protein
MIIAVDFDGTLCEHRFPAIGEPIYPIIDYVKELKAQGWTLILWTCRDNDERGNHLDAAVEWCKGHGIEFDWVNEQVHPEYGRSKVKVLADIYLDDKAINPMDIINDPNRRIKT